VFAELFVTVTGVVQVVPSAESWTANALVLYTTGRNTVL